MMLPDAAKEGAKRALKKLVEQYQDLHLRHLRSGGGLIEAVPNDHAELRRWVGDKVDGIVGALEDEIRDFAGDYDSVNAAYNALKSDENLSQLLEKAMVLR